MRIAINAMVLEPSRPGGDKTYLVELVRRLPLLAPDDEWIVFATQRGSELLPAGIPNLRVVPCPVPGSSLVVRALWEQLVFPDWLRRLTPDLLHAPANVAPLRSPVPVLLTLHEAEPFIPGAGVPGPLLAWWRTLRAQSARRARAVLTVSEAAKQDLVRWMSLPPAKISVVHHGVDADTFRPREPVRERPPYPRPYVLSVGRPSQGKNLPRLIDAFALLRQGGRQETLVLVGPRGWGEPELSEAVARNDASRWVVRRVSPTDRVARWYQNASAFVLPSLRESFGLAILEAMACGTPVVAADIPALREVGGDAAVYADPNSPWALAGALNRVLSDPDAVRQLTTRGLARARSLSWEHTARQTYAHYRQTLSLAPATTRKTA